MHGQLNIKKQYSPCFFVVPISCSPEFGDVFCLKIQEIAKGTQHQW